MYGTVVRAFSLLENLIALSILSIGLLGSAALFSEALRQLQSNTNRRSAVILGEKLIDELIAARERLPAGRSAQCTINVDRCFNDMRLEHLLGQWHERLQHRLPDANAELTLVASTAVTELLINIEWTGRHEQAQSQRLAVLIRT